MFGEKKMTNEIIKTSYNNSVTKTQLSIFDVHNESVVKTDHVNTFGLSQDWIDLIRSKDTDALKIRLESESVETKGKIFEKVMAYILSYSGVLVTETGKSKDYGADLLLTHPDTPDQVAYIVQCKNHNKPIDKDTIVAELEKSLEMKY